MTRERTILRKLAAIGVTRAVVIMVALLAVVGASVAYAETYPGGSDNGKTSRIKQTSSDLATLGYGSTSNTPDWGADWNRIVTAGKWKPQGDIVPDDVRTGKKFYNGSRAEQIGTARVVGPCPTQAWDDFSAQPKAVPATKAQAMINNCVGSWPAASPTVAGDDKKDPVTGLVWSQCLNSTSGTIDFTPASCVFFSWNNSFANNAGKAATELCSERGNGWRLPTQKELMQAYIDGSHFNLSNISSSYWSATQNGSTTAWSVSLSQGTTANFSLTNTGAVRCLR